MKTVELKVDLAVVGGGMAGVVAAVAAARLGCRVALVQDRPVLGGNASSEIRVWVGGAQAHTQNRFAREGGVLNEILMEQLYRNPECSPPVWDAVLLDFVLNESNITLLLDTAVDAVRLASPAAPRRIAGLSGYCSISETRYEISAALFVDSSGDSIVGGLAGAEFRLGKEGREEFGEPTAPPQPDPRCLGASLYFYSRNLGRPVPFVKPDFAIDLSQAPRITRGGFDGHIHGCHLWWLEFGGELDTIHDSAAIKQTLTGIAFGFWDHLKNSGRFPEARDLDLEWLGPMPGKRESRRLVGPYLMTEPDLFSQPDFPDSCATGGWTIDHHPPRGVFDEAPPSRHVRLPGPYNIPLRSLFSRNVDNLFMAGRNISVSNVVFGSTRLMGTGAVCGQAVGTAAHLCLKHGKSPAELADDVALLEEFRQLLVRDDQHIYHVPNRDPADLARAATVRASSELLITGAAPIPGEVGSPRPEPAGTEITRGQFQGPGVAPTSAARWDEWLMVPVTTPHLDSISFQIDATAATTLELEVKRNDRRWHYFPNEQLAERRVKVQKGRRQWVTVPLDLVLQEPGNVWFVVKKNPRLALHGSRQTFTGLTSSRGSRNRWPCPRVDLFAFKISPPQAPYAAANVLNGYARPYIGTNLWMSQEKVSLRPAKATARAAPAAAKTAAPAAKNPFIELSWPRPQKVRQVRLYLSHDPDMQIPTMMMHYPFRAVPTVLRDFTIQARVGGRMKVVARVAGNHRRLVTVDLPQPIETDRLRLVADATNGSLHAELYEIRVY